MLYGLKIQVQLENIFLICNFSISPVTQSSLVEGDEGSIDPSGKLLCLWQTINMKHMHDSIPYMFDCWADPVVHHLLLKSFMPGANPEKNF